MLNRLIVVGAGLLLFGCATPPAVPDWVDHPANPASAAAPLPPPSQTLAVTQAATTTAPTMEHEAPAMPGMNHGSGAMQHDMSGMTPGSRPSPGGQP